MLTQEEIRGIAPDENMSLSLKVYAMAFGIAMKVYTGSAESIEAHALLEVCREEVARSH